MQTINRLRDFFEGKVSVAGHGTGAALAAVVASIGLSMAPVPAQAAEGAGYTAVIIQSSGFNNVANIRSVQVNGIAACRKTAEEAIERTPAKPATTTECWSTEGKVADVYTCEYQRSSLSGAINGPRKCAALKP